MRSYLEMVVGPLKKMSQDNQQMMLFRNKAATQQKRYETLEKSFGLVTQKLRQKDEESKIVRLRSKEQHEENKIQVNHLSFVVFIIFW